MKPVKLALLAGISAVAIGWGIAKSTPLWFAPKETRQVDISDPALIAQGEYLAKAGDCVACHTAPGGAAFAGGLGLQTPMGTIYATNITPDPETGIGNYDFGDFERAVRKGIRPDGTPLYPAMPFVSYQVVEDADIEAMYAYFMSEVAPVAKENQPATIPWPASMRWPLAWWQLLFAQPRTSETTAYDDPLMARGAYLIEGLGHCGACHTPRGLVFQEKAVKDDASGDFLSGSVLEGWYAKNLRNEDTGLVTWTEQEIADFLKTGRNHRTAAFGSMSDVVEHSLQHLSDRDIAAISRYLKSISPRPGREKWTPHEDVTTTALRTGDFTTPGALTYVEHCASCHRLDGMGAPAVYPALKGNSMVFADDPSSLIQITLAGGRMPKTPAHSLTFAMPAFAKLTNADLAELMTYIRNSWGNHASTVTAADIAEMRHELTRKPVHYTPEAGQ
ncbi:MAG: cytochrome c [Pseudomonadota bacterium]